MALNEVINKNGTLLAKTFDGTAVAEPITQDEGEKDFESIREARAIWHLANISEPTSSPDNLVAASPINEGDRLILVKDDNSTVDFIAEGVKKSTRSMIPKMTDNTTPAGVASSSTGDAWKVFDGSDGTVISVGGGTSSLWVAYNFENNERKFVKNVYVKAYYYYGWCNMSEIHIQGSMDGVIWQTLSIHAGLNHSEMSSGKILTIQSPGSYSHYRVYTPGVSEYSGFRTVSLLTDEGDALDTTDITAGETPSKVFRFMDVLKFNGVPAIEKDIYLKYGTTGDKLLAFPIYHDVSLYGRTLTTSVEFSAPGNEVTEITGQIYKAV